MFNYVSVAQDPDDLRSEFIIDDDTDEDNDEWQSDKVRLGLNLAYLPEVLAKNLSFAFKGNPR